MIDDASTIFKLYVEAIVEQEQPQLHVDRFGANRWMLHGKMHRDGAPAFESPGGSTGWFRHGRAHREGAPAFEYAHGSKEWWVDGERHREDGPAVESSDGTKMWFRHNLLHREDGPAAEYVDGDKTWYLNGVKYLSPEDWARTLLKRRGEPYDVSAVDAFLRQIFRKDAEAAL